MNDTITTLRQILDAAPNPAISIPQDIFLNAWTFANANGISKDDFKAFVLAFQKEKSQPAVQENMKTTPVVDLNANAPAPAVKVKTESDQRYNQYRDYLSAIFQPGDTLCVVGIEHSKPKGDDTTQFFVPFERAVSREYFDVLDRANEDGSIYVATNTFKPELVGQMKGRTQENVTAVRAIQADVDYNGDATMDAIKSSAVVPPPSIVVESSPGKFQGIWLVDGISKEEAKPLMQAIASTFNTDSAVAEVARVMRVPGFVNRKYGSAPIARTLVQTTQRYRREDFKVHVASSSEMKPPKSPEWYKDLVLQHGQIHDQLLELVGWYIRVKNIKDPEVLYSIVTPYCEKAVDRDGSTPYSCDMDLVKTNIEKWCKEFKTGDEFKVAMSSTQQAPQQQPAQQPVDVSNWQSLFRAIGEMEDGPIDMIVEGVLQEGTCFLGANAGDGKTLVALAFAKAITMGEPLFNIPEYRVEKPRPVIYLIPESRDRAFRKRCEAFHLPDDKSKFMTRTISAGVPLELSDPRLIEAVRQTKAVVVLDTASRFMKGNDENAAAQNRLLVNDVVALLAAGAVCVILLHHATKSAKMNQERMTLENMLRGTGDFGAMCDQAYGIRKDMNLYANGSGPMEIDLVSLKDREQIGGLSSLRLAASYKKKSIDKGVLKVTFPQSYIKETGNFHVVSTVESLRREVTSIQSAVQNDPTMSAADYADLLGFTKYRVENELKRLGYHRVKGGPGGASPWHKDENGVCPFEKKDVVEVKPPKKTFDMGLPDVVRELKALLDGTSPDGEFVPETRVLAWADKKGIPEAQLAKARRRLGVVVSKEGDIKTWALPEPEEDEPEEQEPTRPPNEGGVEEAF